MIIKRRSKQSWKIMEEVSVSQATLEKLRCSICEDYLSCSPIRVLPDGGSICGCCLPPVDEGPTYRNLILEEMLSKLSFPCKFRKEGCEECLLFDQTKHHEGNCCYNTIPCPLLTSCAWTGLILNLPNHFTENHADCIKDDIEFEIQTNQDKQDVFMVTKDKIPFVINYEFNCSNSELQYNFSYISPNVKEMTYRVRLTSNTDSDYSITVKGDRSVSYRTRSVLNVDQYLKNLGNPSSLMVVLLLKVSKSCRWRGCDRVEYDISSHEQLCQFRLRKCHFCDVLFNFKTAQNHLRQHNCIRVSLRVREDYSQETRFVFNEKRGRFYFIKNDKEILYVFSKMILEECSITG